MIMGKVFRAKQHPIQENADPLWYRDAIIYQLHVKSFADSNGDGIGDFGGLIARLDYIADLGVDVIWLLPFYPSPRRDDGYDISDYRGVHPDYGTMADLRRFIDGAHDRGIRVITELVINHTSDQHPWFQRARAAKPGSALRDFYVWSDTDQAYAGTRVIFVDTEKSNWTWDPAANAYYWHRFYSHQPDLNFDNPRVLREILAIMRFWLDTGVDGLRLDAVPYLVEREGTHNENLPETHAILRQIRAELDTYAPGRMLLAEANQWPEDAQQYFGAGDECNMSFHFPLMPRLYMSIAREDRLPITDIMRQTPAIPENCQWVVFLRNHDELTLEMVTDSERDYLWNVYAADRRARINLGIRRRLAPLMEHDRRRMELMTGLLLSMPGTPVIYYGDEIGMGDNVYLGDRDGVRTPMQWSPDRNGGFSRASPESLVLPPIMHPVYGYASVNVEAQAGDQHSLLNWTRRLLAVRRNRRATFGRGAQVFLYPANRKILAFLREYEGETLLCVSNLARTAQAVELDLSAFAGRVPVDLLGGTPFPAIGQLTYLLTLPPYAFFWFILATEADLPGWRVPAPEQMPDLTTYVLRRGLREIRDEKPGAMLESETLPAYLTARRWFAAKDKTIEAVHLSHVATMTHGTGEFLLADCDVVLIKGGAETYQLPLGIAWEDEPASALPQQMALARIRQGRRVGWLTDAFTQDGFVHEIINLMRTSQSIPFDGGELRFTPTAGFDAADIPPDAAIRRLPAEQSNSSLILGTAAILKLLRRGEPGIHPEIEMSAYLTANGYTNSPPLLGVVTRHHDKAEPRAIVVLQGFVRNQGDAWAWSLDTLSQLADEQAVLDDDAPEEPASSNIYVAFAHVIGTRLAELHAVLAGPTEDPAFKPERITAADTMAWAREVTAQTRQALNAIAAVETWSDPHAAADAAYLKQHGAALIKQIPALAAAAQNQSKTRVHGDFHLGQVLIAQGDAILIDFEGEPARTLDERRAKFAPISDAAGMLRSFDYARAVASAGRAAMTPRIAGRRVAILQHMHEQACAAFLDGYQNGTPADRSVLDFFLLRKAAYEVCYEAANRIPWLPVPLRGLAELAAHLVAQATP